MARELVLYVGLHKTASSSIQQTCADNQARLRAAGFVYPTFTMDGEQDSANHTRLLRNIFRHHPARLGLGGQIVAGTDPWTQADRETLKARLASTLLSADARVILAAEGLSTYSADELADVREWLSSAGFRPRVICHVRHISSWLNSMVAQRVRGQVGLTIAEAVDELLNAGGLVRPRIEVVRSVFPETEFFSHEAAASHPHGPPGFFLETIGFTNTNGIRWKRVNDGASDLAVRVLSIMNERFGRVRWQGSFEDLAQFRFQRGVVAIEQLRGPKFRMVQSEAAPLATLIADENAWLRDQLGQAFHDPDPTFAGDVPKATAEQVIALKAAIRACQPVLRDYLLQALAPPTGIEPVSSA